MNTSHIQQHKAFGKVILFGEHAVVYGQPALAGGVDAAISAHAEKLESVDGTLRRISIPQWGIHTQVENLGDDNLIHQMLNKVCELLELNDGFHLEIDANIPHASGLGASAAVAVSSIRALAAMSHKSLTPSQVNDIAFQCEKIAHGTPSGLDNTLATYGGLQVFQRNEKGEPTLQAVNTTSSIPLIVAHSGKKGYTAQTVARVRKAREANRAMYDGIFNAIGDITRHAVEGLNRNDLSVLPELMNENQALLRKIDVSCDEIERVITLAKDAGAAGAKLTGSGDGGAVLIYAGSEARAVIEALHQSQITCFNVQLNHA